MCNEIRKLFFLSLNYMFSSFFLSYHVGLDELVNGREEDTKRIDGEVEQ